MLEELHKKLTEMQSLKLNLKIANTGKNGYKGELQPLNTSGYASENFPLNTGGYQTENQPLNTRVYGHENLPVRGDNFPLYPCVPAEV